MAVNMPDNDEIEEQTERFQMRATPTFLRLIDNWRRKQSDLPSRAEAIRRLVQMGMKYEIRGRK
jgi:hypothetical protein